MKNYVKASLLSWNEFRHGITTVRITGGCPLYPTTLYKSGLFINLVPDAIPFLLIYLVLFTHPFSIMEAFQSVYIPKQTPRKAYNLKSMKAVITSYPPLGQVTLVEGATTTFIVLLETDKSRATDAWGVSLWYSQGEEWREQELNLVDENVDLPLVIQIPVGTSSHHLYFITTVDIVSSMSFTIKFRSAPDQPWEWVKDQQMALDGIVLSKTKISKSRTEDLDDLIKDLNPIVKATKVLSQSPDTSVWSVTAPVEAADVEKSAMVNIKFGLPWAGKILRYGNLLDIVCSSSTASARS